MQRARPKEAFTRTHVCTQPKSTSGHEFAHVFLVASGPTNFTRISYLRGKLQRRLEYGKISRNAWQRKGLGTAALNLLVLESGADTSRVDDANS